MRASVVTRKKYYLHRRVQSINERYFSPSSDVTRGLFACTLLFEFVSFSKRFVPECVTFLTAVLSMALPQQAFKNPGWFSNFFTPGIQRRVFMV